MIRTVIIQVQVEDADEMPVWADSRIISDFPPSEYGAAIAEERESWAGGTQYRVIERTERLIDV